MSLATMIMRDALNIRVTNEFLVDGALHFAVHCLFALMMLHHYNTYLQKEME
ncbi:hypothetical protein [Sediminicola luteus]|uniref:hypothetical protein n=1 Tax=Sediminicola luteus TaxID=319238 RepID=UPI001556197C|nr:hypothetical protein [Sediminicola luteus]